MFHYSLKTLMLIVVGASVFFALFFAVPMFVTAIVFVVVLLFSAPALLAGCLYLRGRWQAFCIGAAVPTSLAMLGIVLGDGFADDIVENVLLEPMFRWYYEDAVAVKLTYLVYLVVVGLSGFTSLGVFRLAQRRGPGEKSCPPSPGNAE